MRYLIPILLTLCMPLPNAAAQSPDSPVTGTTIPFDMSTGRPVVELSINGDGPFPFIFDTGSPLLVIIGDLRDELALVATGTQRLGSPAGGQTLVADTTTITSLELGELVLSGVDATLLDVPGFPAAIGRGVIGPALFQEYGSVTIDFTTQTITIGGHSDFPSNTQWMPIDPQSLHLNADVRVGDESIPGHIDTGAPGILSLPARYQDIIPLSGPLTLAGSARLVDTEFEIYEAPIDLPVQVGDLDLQVDRVVFGQNPVANIGNGALAGSRIHYDWANMQFALTRADTETPPPAPPARFGLMAIPPDSDGILGVRGTQPGSPAEDAGLLAGDRILAINGTMPGELGMASIRSAFGSRPLEMTVDRNGETLTLTLR
jgi:PDZ domain/Aspartyl protease